MSVAILLRKLAEGAQDEVANRNPRRDVQSWSPPLRRVEMGQDVPHRELVAGASGAPAIVRQVADGFRSNSEFWRKTMRFPTWGDTVLVRASAPATMHPGAIAAVVGNRDVETPEQATQFETPIGSKVYLIEFSNGEAIEVAEIWIEPVAV